MFVCLQSHAKYLEPLALFAASGFQAMCSPNRVVQRTQVKKQDWNHESKSVHEHQNQVDFDRFRGVVGLDF